MEIENLAFESKLGKPAIFTYRYHPEGSQFLTILLPGQAYYKDAPLIWYTAIAAFQAGADTLSVEYAYQANRLDLDQSSMKVTREELKCSIDEFLGGHSYKGIFVVSKSIGTVFASELGTLLNQRISSYVFLTPLRATIEFMRKCMRLLVLVGEEDPVFNKEDINTVRALPNAEILSFPGANHILEIPGDFEGSLGILEQTAKKCYDFIKSEVKRAQES